MKNILTIIGCALLSILIVFVIGENSDSRTFGLEKTKEDSLIAQEIISYDSDVKEYYKLYDGERLIGIVSDIDKFNEMTNSYYLENYANDFPNTSMTLSGDYYFSTELGFYKVEDRDEEIFAYVRDHGGLGIVTNVIDFSTAEGIFATIYVADMDIFNAARTTFLNYFVSESERNLLATNTALDEMTEVGQRAVGYRIEETISTHKGVADPKRIMTSKKEVLEYLCYGNNTNREYYTVQEGDTLQGVGYMNGDLSPEQIMMLNPNQIFSTDQILTPGMVLNVTYFTSPIHVVVTKEKLDLEEVYADQAIVLQDPDLFEGSSETIQEEKSGSAYVLYEETWINGVLMSGRQVSESVITQPIQAIIAVGSTQKPNVGTGNFRWPVDNAHLTCGWACYIGHEATDVVNRYNRYDYVYAADNGTVITNSYDSISGNYIVIDHNNGFQTYYGHMMEPSPLKVGDTVMKGDVIGQIGTTGKVTGPHVHFEIRVDGVKVDPCIYMNCEAIE